MEHLFRGKEIQDHELHHALSLLKDTVNTDLLLEPLDSAVVVHAIVKLLDQMDYDYLKDQLLSIGVFDWKADELITTIRTAMTKEALETKISRELGSDFNRWTVIDDVTKERRQPLGVLMHIGAGNVIALSVLSVLEGCLSGNINVLKLPSYEGGISLMLLKELLRIEPRLAPYIYVFDIRSTDIETLRTLSEVADAIIVWGSDEAIAGIRQIIPPTIQLIEWGHRLSFAYFTLGNHYQNELEGLAKEICISNQLNCSSPQTVFLETTNIETVKAFSKELLDKLIYVAQDYAIDELDIPVQGEITWTKENVRTESVLGQRYLYESDDQRICVMVDLKPKLKSSPKYRNIWVVPIRRNELLPLLREHKGHLQTAGLECDDGQRDALTQLLFAAGVNRVTTCEQMSTTYVGEPHDGKSTLVQYTRKVSMRR
jgi:hypothetical protein